jgi:hypothetical protein
MVQAGRTVHITVAVADAADQSAVRDTVVRDTVVLDAAVLVEVWSRKTGERIVATPATTEQSTNKLYYETDFILPEAGAVEIRIQASGPAGEGQARFNTDVRTAANTSWLYPILLGVGVLAITVIWRAWSKRAQAARGTAARPRARQRQRISRT